MVKLGSDCKLDFIIVGVMKSGTTTLAHSLEAHPQIAIPKHEVRFFNANFDKGIQWYHDQFAAEINENTRIVGEKTPYSYRHRTAKMIHDYNPDIKLIWIFRNPVERAISNYYHDFTNIREWRTLEACLQRDKQRKPAEQYLTIGHYAEQIEIFERFFPRHQMHYMLFEDLIANRQDELNKIASFLNIDYKPFELTIEKKAKVSRIPARRPWALYFYAKYFKSSGWIWTRLWKLHFNGKGQKKVSQRARKFLAEYYLERNLKFAQLTGLNIEHWNK